MPDELTTFDVPRPDLDVTALFRDVEVQPPHPPEVTYETVRAAYEALAREQEARRRHWVMVLFAHRTGLLSDEEMRRLCDELYHDVYAENMTRALRSVEAALWRRVAIAQEAEEAEACALRASGLPCAICGSHKLDPLDRPVNTRWVEEGPHQGDDSGGGLLASEILRPVERLDRIRSRIGEVLDG